MLLANLDLEPLLSKADSNAEKYRSIYYEKALNWQKIDQLHAP